MELQSPRSVVSCGRKFGGMPFRPVVDGEYPTLHIPEAELLG